MKKRIALIMVLVLLVSCLSVGCKKIEEQTIDKDSSVASIESGEESDNDDSSVIVAEIDVVDPVKIVQEVVAEANKEIDSLKEVFADTMEIAITAKGTAVVYTYTYVIDIPDVDAVADALESSLEAQSAVFEGIVDALKSEGVKEGSVIIEYLTKDGEMIYTIEYK